MRKMKGLAALGLAVLMAVGIPAEALAGAEGYDAETWQKLQDNVLEYEEIQNLVKEYSPAFQMMQAGIDAQAPIASGNKAISNLREQVEEYQSLYKMAKDEGDTVNAEIYRKIYTGMRKEADKAEKSLNSGTRSIVNRTQKELTSAVQGLMITYHQILASRDMAQAAAELAQAGYDAAKTQLSIGMATETDVQSAEKDMLEAQAGLRQAEDGMTAVRQNLCILTGWSYDASPEIGSVPEPDFTRIDGMNPQADSTKAVSNNYDLISLRSSTAKGTVRNRTVEEAEALIRTNLESLYQEVIQNKAAYEAASTAFQSAQLTMDAEDTKYQLGMLGRPEYLMKKLSYQQQKMAYIQASLALTQSMESYGWAVEGLAEIE